MYIYFEMIFPEKFTDHYASKFRDGDCPLRKQVEYSAEEEVKDDSSMDDPVGDKDAEIDRGILQKYKGRLLVLASNSCAINCRFCFRRNMSYEKHKDLPQRLAGILEKDKTIKEVIFSGGEPLMLKNGELRAFFRVIPKNVNIRIHSRMPVVLPERFSHILLEMLKPLGMRLIFVSHINHPNELDEQSRRIFSYLAWSKVKLLNQSVLLRGVNDSPEILAKLSEKLCSQGVLPYYLHQLDRAQGTVHFEVPIKRAKSIFAKLKGLLPGYLVPRLVTEIKGKKSKTWIA
jgi:EF-P beta-lysylation protein EpmB